jgi:uncharacterized protein YkwD
MKTGFLFLACLLLACSSGTGTRAELGPDGVVIGSGSASASSSSSSGGSASNGSAISASGSSSSSSSGGASAGDDAGADSDLQHCVDVINSYRATLSGVLPYARSSSLEQFAAVGAEDDSQTGEAHGHFIGTNGGNGVAYAENEIPGWPEDQYGSITAVIDQGMQMMWAEGPGGGHYDNMASTQYTQAGCGIYVTSDGSVWITTDFR